MIHKNRFSKKSSKNLYPLSKPLLSLENFWSFGGLDKGFYGITLSKQVLYLIIFIVFFNLYH